MKKFFRIDIMFINWNQTPIKFYPKGAFLQSKIIKWKARIKKYSDTTVTEFSFWR